MKNSRGFSLIEVLVAMGLLAVAMLYLAPLFTGGMKTNAVGWDYSVLNSLVKQRLEELLQYNFNDPRLAVPGGATAVIDDPNNPPGSTGRITTITVTGQIYTNQAALIENVAGVQASVPYKSVYLVQDYRLQDIPQTGLPDEANAKTDADPSWNALQDVKLITVYGLSIRVLQGTQKVAAGWNFTGSPYSVGMFHLQTISGSRETPAKQIRMTAIKSP